VVTTGAVRRKIITTDKPTPSFFKPSCRPTNSVKALKEKLGAGIHNATSITLNFRRLSK